jgi:replicative DNA helicase
LFLYRDSIYHPEADETLAELIIAKQRNGPTGTIHLEFTGRCAMFNTTTRRPPAGPSSTKKPGDPF